MPNRNDSQVSNPREAAFLVLTSAHQNHRFLSDILEIWRKQTKLTPLNFRLAQELAIGIMRRQLTLNFLIQKLFAGKKWKLTFKRRVFFYLALYQHFFMDRIPLYASVNETVSLSKKYCGETFAKFLNASLRRLEKTTCALPEGSNPQDMSIRYSYPLFFIKELLKEYPNDKVKSILEAGNKPPSTLFRIRRSQKKQTFSIFSQDPLPFGIVEDFSLLSTIATSPDFYIQNITPFYLIKTLSEGKMPPKNILDLCASPGGKLLALHDLFPQAKLFANDLSSQKLKALKQNCSKYGIEAALSCTPGENFSSSLLFDLIVLDVPCSNSGVLNKRAEARWRLTPSQLEKLSQTQLKLLKHASNLLSPKGEIWYLTCSILQTENEKMAETICRETKLHTQKKVKVLPTLSGWDGGFGCILSKN